uniref:Putative secreted protein n=1 Tax=Ixodes ricinus TaxID=34613 RepID=V5GJV4_IXORI
MRIMVGALAFASFIFWFSAEARLTKVFKNKKSAKKNITIGFLLDGFTHYNARPDSKIGKWLTKVNNKAEALLKKDLGMDITLEISSFKVLHHKLDRVIKTWTTDGQMHADTVVGYMKTYFTEGYNPDILCLVTRYKLYGDNGLNDEPGYSKHKDLCKDMVPTIMQYNLRDTKKSGKSII